MGLEGGAQRIFLHADDHRCPAHQIPGGIDTFLGRDQKGQGSVDHFLREPDTLFDGPRLIIKTDSAAVDSVAVDSLNVPIASPDTSGVQSKVIEENDGKIIEVFEAPVRKRQPRIEAQLDTVATE